MNHWRCGTGKPEVRHGRQTSIQHGRLYSVLYKVLITVHSRLNVGAESLELRILTTTWTAEFAWANGYHKRWCLAAPEDNLLDTENRKTHHSMDWTLRK